MRSTHPGERKYEKSGMVLMQGFPSQNLTTVPTFFSLVTKPNEKTQSREFTTAVNGNDTDKILTPD